MRLPLTNYFATAVLIKREVLAAVIISLKHIYIYIIKPTILLQNVKHVDIFRHVLYHTVHGHYNKHKNCVICLDEFQTVILSRVEIKSKPLSEPNLSV